MQLELGHRVGGIRLVIFSLWSWIGSVNSAGLIGDMIWICPLFKPSDWLTFCSPDVKWLISCSEIVVGDSVGGFLALFNFWNILINDWGTLFSLLGITQSQVNWVESQCGYISIADWKNGLPTRGAIPQCVNPIPSRAIKLTIFLTPCLVSGIEWWHHDGIYDRSRDRDADGWLVLFAEDAVRLLNNIHLALKGGVSCEILQHVRINLASLHELHVDNVFSHPAAPPPHS